MRQTTFGFGERLATTAFLSTWLGLVAGYLTWSADLILGSGGVSWGLVWTLGLVATAGAFALIWRNLEGPAARGSDSGAEYDAGMNHDSD
ncbi:hypothetical protein [Streptomyces fructofermentans]|uniref:Uncharacterized protein n=1 Tax=Streptomyces fructofermentans TaxID=152141 RepID=A0A918NM23_9ACTN|nr:hypothetical protein [Streptomyces fructofermentans]GGX80185.1 hypothetical protein GCM10010515_54840 [Streptomyces fructofermentans]